MWQAAIPSLVMPYTSRLTQALRLRAAKLCRDHVSVAGGGCESGIVGLHVNGDGVESVSGQDSAGTLSDHERCRDGADEGCSDGSSGKFDGTALVAAFEVGERGCSRPVLTGNVVLPSDHLVAGGLCGEPA